MENLWRWNGIDLQIFCLWHPFSVGRDCEGGTAVHGLPKACVTGHSLLDDSTCQRRNEIFRKAPDISFGDTGKEQFAQ